MHRDPSAATENLTSWKRLFSRALASDPRRLHFAAHSHHPWPDATFEAQQAAWLDAATLLDGKWEKILGTVLPEVQGHIARVIGSSQPRNLAIAPNTHEFVLRLLSCFGDRSPVRVLASDSEFHSFSRQAARLEECGKIELTRVPTEPFDTFPERFAAAAQRAAHDLVFVSHVFFNSGYVFREVFDIAAALDADTYFVVDGYHGFMALPTDLGPFQDRVFYLSGGYKYAMSGEGVCFLHAPEGYASRPENTGWFATFGALQEAPSGGVAYPVDGYRMFGSTFDPSGLYRFRAVMDLLRAEGLTVAGIHAHVRRLQAAFLERLEEPEVARASGLRREDLVPSVHARERGHFLTFRVPDAAARHDALARQGVVTDYRADRWRFGFGIYQDPADVDELFERLARAR